MKTFDNCALFIGVNDYRTFDQSTGAPPGTSDLAGSRNDVLSFYRVCRQMGIGPENIRVLTSPKLTTDDLQGLADASIREATKQEILDGVDWLARRIGGKDGPPGLFTYSGHGDFKEGEGLVVCPSDTSGRNLDHAIPLAKIQEVFAKQAALESLTVVLDCCHSGATRGARKALSLTGRKVPPAMATGLASIGERVLSAAAPKGTSYQSRFAGEHHGGFSWALTSAMDQWTARAEGSSVELSVSYGDLLMRARGLLATLGFDQVPELKGPPFVEQIPFFHRGRGGRREETSVSPDKHRRGGQLNPDAKYYSLDLSSGMNQSWTVYVNGATATFQGNTNTEFWGIDESFTSAMSGEMLNGTTLTFAPAPSTAPAQMPAQSLWTQTSAPSNSMFFGTNSDGNVVGLMSTLQTGTPWQGMLTWYVAVPSGDPPEYVVAKNLTLTYGPASAYGPESNYRNYQWYTMALPPLSWGTKSSSVDESYSGAALAQMNDILYCAYVYAGQIWVLTSQDGQSVQQRSVVYFGNSPVNASSNAPALACMSGTLYLACRTTSGQVAVGSYQSGNLSSWSAVPLSPAPTTATSPALGVGTDGSGNALLCLAYNAGISMQLLVWSGSSWTAQNGPGTAATGAPAIAGFGTGLFLAQIGSGGTTIEIYQATNLDKTASWSSTPAVIQIPTETASISSVSLAVYNGLLYLSFTDSAGNVGICSSADGQSFSGFANVSSQVAGVTSNTNAPIAAFGTNAGTLALAITNPYPYASVTWNYMYLVTAN